MYGVEQKFTGSNVSKYSRFAVFVVGQNLLGRIACTLLGAYLSGLVWDTARLIAQPFTTLSLRKCF